MVSIGCIIPSPKAPAIPPHTNSLQTADENENAQNKQQYFRHFHLEIAHPPGANI